ncbi:MAG: purine-nucleoside phosphorylase [Candidatus Gastranaerophilales bacterium]|nr:purine-nucleoside phosphorylase [Candidatus Gastranaerophilales bacterium]
MLNHTVEFIKEHTKGKYNPKTALILGSGLGDLANEVSGVRIRYHEIPAFVQSSIEGHAGQLVIGKLEGKQVLVMQGRIHYYEGHEIQKIVYPVKVMKKLGVENLIITNAAGGVSEKVTIGDLMLINDHINFMGVNPLIGANANDLGERFPDMSEVYNPALREKTKKIAAKLGINLKEGIYAATSGPSYETPAEIKMFRTLGADAVGMSTVPEAIVANYCGMKILGISCITNMAAGVTGKRLNHSEVIEEGQKVKENFTKLIRQVIRHI